ncbi:LacI family DNA-binding transcriptional regulator [Streptomyces radicis]|uniref:LacI family transcriptional regulator n=1 Tax=Streptomyces radicis TaxID=1750517 RepID=A0A3A9W585_9ACTN|nr:LacI family DNA-binding transcriptional regulator [Streptomyces radicis]RKN08395.1 LacI family transcriptional regulator [Streptomyces radicis]RKN21571.1 LacI family transcriptional regulator [Streptomyces radicis]
MGRTRRRTGAGGARRVTQADVAAHAGVSTGIVSSVINERDYGSIRVSQATRDRVWRSVKELGYVPNIAARNLARGSNRLIGVFTYQPLFPLESRDFYHEFLVGIEEEAERAGYHLLLFTGSQNAGRQRSIYAEGINSLQLADGSVLVGTDESSEEIARLAADSYPFVFVGQREIPGVELSYVAADYLGGTAAIVHELAARGHRRIAMVQSAHGHEGIPGRRAGFRRARAELGLSAADAPVLTLGEPPLGVDSDGTLADATAAAAWAAGRGATALVVEDSTHAVHIRDAAERAGRSVPGDLALVGLSGAPERPGVADLAEISIPRREMGQEAVRALVGLLADPGAAPPRVTLDCSLREGPSLGPPRDVD